MVCGLRRGICGLKQGPRCCNGILDAYLREIGFLPLVGDPCVYILLHWVKWQ